MFYFVCFPHLSSFPIFSHLIFSPPHTYPTLDHSKRWGLSTSWNDQWLDKQKHILQWDCEITMFIWFDLHRHTSMIVCPPCWVSFYSPMQVFIFSCLFMQYVLWHLTDGVPVFVFIFPNCFVIDLSSIDGNFKCAPCLRWHTSLS